MYDTWAHNEYDFGFTVAYVYILTGVLFKWWYFIVPIYRGLTYKCDTWAHNKYDLFLLLYICTL